MLAAANKKIITAIRGIKKKTKNKDQKQPFLSPVKNPTIFNISPIGYKNI